MNVPAVPVVENHGPDGRGVAIVARDVRKYHRDGTTALDSVDLTIRPGRLTAIVGPSGAGKTTLLAALAGLAPVDAGTVTFHGEDEPANDNTIGFVPQDDILHGELPLRRTLRYAASLRLAAPAADLERAVTEAMNTLGLSGLDDVLVRSLSGGQRKRASIACEILTHPSICFLDEPTSGLDPAAARALVACLERMAEQGATVVFTTHSIADVARSDDVVVVAPGGRLAAAGPPAAVLRTFRAHDFTEVYERLARSQLQGALQASRVPAIAAPTGPSSRRSRFPRRPGALTQWLILTRRAAEILTRSRLTLTILLGSPMAVISMFAVLFRRGAAATDPAGAVQVAYWLSFAGFFFGLTFGLLQVCTEIAVLRREHHAGVRTGAYLASKIALLMPVLLFVNAAMIFVLTALDRIPDLPASALLALYLTTTLDALAALCLGLLASAAVTTTAQAALALPMLCFPAVLFSGAMVPLPVMTSSGQAIASVISARWAFEAIGRDLHVAAVAGQQSPYARLGASATSTYWTLLALFAVAFASAGYVTVRRRIAREVR